MIARKVVGWFKGCKVEEGKAMWLEYQIKRLLPAIEGQRFTVLRDKDLIMFQCDLC